MAQQRQTFRFRLPWLPAASSPRRTADAQPTPTPATGQPPTAAPFRPSVSSPAVAQPPPQVEASTRTESQPPSPSLNSTYQPASPSLAATQSRVASRPPSPRLAPQSPSQSPSRRLAGSQLPAAGQTSSLPPSSPSLTSARAVTDHPPSPSENLQPTTQETSLLQPPPSSTEPRPPVFQQEPKPTLVSQAPESQEPQPNTQTTSDINVLNSQNQTSIIQTTLSANGRTPTPAPTQKANSSIVSPESKPPPESDEKPEEPKEGKEVVQELRKEEGKTNGGVSAYEEPKQRTVVTVSSGSNAPAKEQPSFTFQTEQKQTKTAFSNLKDKNRVSESNRERVPLHKEIREDIFKFVHKMATGHPKQSMDEKLVSVITLAGENRGASMQLCSESAKRDGSVSVHIQREYKSNPDESLEATTDGEGSSRDSNTINDEDQSTKAYVNSNIQGINNSLVFNSSVTERNPGVHLVFSRNRTEESTKSSDNRTESLETRKAEFNITPAQKLTYEPVVKRRCLRGLFMESSDSDPDNPEKPRRHGCRYSCREMSKDDQEIDVL